jgi:hypothetical protein
LPPASDIGARCKGEAGSIAVEKRAVCRFLTGIKAEEGGIRVCLRTLRTSVTTADMNARRTSRIAYILWNRYQFVVAKNSTRG